MSESLRDLVVTLSLNSDNFTKNIKTISSMIKEAQSEFMLAAAGNENYEKSLEGMRAKSASLNQQLGLQNKAVEQNRRALDAARTKLTASVEANKRLSASLDDAKKRYVDIQSEIKRYTEAYDEAVRTMGQDTADQLFGDTLADLRTQASGAQEEIKKLNSQLTVSNRTVRNNADAVTRAGTAYNKAQAAVKQTQAEITKLDKSIKAQESKWYSLSQSLENFSKKAEKVGNSASKIGHSLTVAMTTPIVGAVAAVSKASIDYESAFTSVRKTVDATEGEFEELSSEIKKMSTEIATDATEIAETFAIAGQMGIEADNLAEFARVMIDLGNSTDIIATDAAASLSQFRNITGMATDDFDRLGSTLVDLGNNFATTESKIMDMSLRLSGAGAQIGLTEPEILAFATALSSVGIEAEMGGSAFSKALIKMEVASETGGEALEDFAKVAGMSSDAFASMWKSDPTGAFMSFLEGLANMDEQGMSAIATLNEIGIAEVRLRDTLLRSTNAVELLADAQVLANRAWDKNVALSNEANRRYATTESRLKNLKNKTSLFAMQLGDDLNPTIHNLIDGADGFIEKLNDMTLSQRETLLQTAGFAAAAGPAISVFGKLASAASSVAGKLAPFAMAVAKAGGGLTGFITALTASPVAMAGLVAALGLGAAAFVDYASGAKRARDAVSGLRDTADQWKRTQAETLYDNEGLGAFGLNVDAFKNGEKDFLAGAQSWVDGLLGVWSDGKRESRQEVKEWIDSFKELNTGVRDELTAMQADADQYGYTGVSESIQADIDTLNSMDKEIEKLLNNRRNRKFSEKDQIRLNELIDQREAIVVKYRLEEETGKSGYQAILDQLNKDEAKAAATGTTVTTERYGEALKATAEGFKTVRSELDAWYDAEYDVVQLIEDEMEREEARAALDRRYNEERTKAAREYANALAEFSPEVFKSEEYTESAKVIDDLTGKMRELDYAIKSGDAQGQSNILADINQITSSMDEGKLTSYYTTLTQIQSLYKDFGMDQGEVESMFGIDVEGELTQLASIQTAATNAGTELESLKTMFGEALPQEIEPILVELDMTNAQTAWTEFASNPGAITATVESYDDSAAPELNPLATCTINKWDMTSLDNYIKANPVQVDGVFRIKDFTGDPTELLSQDGTRVFDANGMPIPVTPTVVQMLTVNDLVVTNEQGGVDIIVTPKINGDVNLADEMKSLLETPSETGKGFYGQTFDGEKLVPESVMTKIKDVKDEVQYVLDNQDNFLGALFGKSATADAEKYLTNMFTADDVANLQAYVTEMTNLASAGATFTPDMVAQFTEVTTFLEGIDTLGIGENITAGIAEGMQTEVDWTTAAQSVGDGAINALKTALGIESPSTVARDQVGTYIAEGVADGMESYSFSAAGKTMGNNAISAAKNAMPFSSGASIGRNFGNGIASGIRAAMPTIVAAARDAASSGVNAAKAELVINSPSRKTHDEIGVMFSRGIASGVKDEAEKQSKVIANAARFITDSAAGVVAGSTYNNQKSYNNSSSVNLTVENLHVRNDQDIRSLAIEIASLVKRQNAGYGTPAVLKG